MIFRSEGTSTNSSEYTSIQFEGKTALFGGTFNPIHYGHLRVAEEVREELQLNKVVFIPSSVPPLKKRGLIDAKHRLEMVRIATSGNPYFEVSDVECRRPGKSYTVETLEYLKDRASLSDPLFILGLDAFLEISLWYKPERLIELCDFVVVNRPPNDILDVKKSEYVKKNSLKMLKDGVYAMDLISGRKVLCVKCTPLWISASEIRERISNKRSIKYLLPESVETYIISHNLYRG